MLKIAKYRRTAIKPFDVPTWLGQVPWYRNLQSFSGHNADWLLQYIHVQTVCLNCSYFLVLSGEYYTCAVYQYLFDINYDLLSSSDCGRMLCMNLCSPQKHGYLDPIFHNLHIFSIRYPYYSLFISISSFAESLVKLDKPKEIQHLHSPSDINWSSPHEIHRRVTK